MTLNSPIFLTKVKCPVCETVNEFETIRVGAYTEGDRDTDFCPTSIKWRNKRYQQYNPLLFFTATCANCFYTREFNNKFKDWQRDNNFLTYRRKIIQERHMSELDMEESVISLLGSMIDNENYPDESAVIKLLLAIYDEQQNDHPSNLDLGRFYLRVAWIFRQSGQGVEPEMTARQGVIEDIENSFADLRHWVAGFDRNIQYFEEAASRASESGSDTFGESCQKLHQLLEQCTDLIHEIEPQVEAFQTAVASGISYSGSSHPYYDYESFTDFLCKMHLTWDGVPRNELEAVRKSVQFYIRAFEAGKEVPRGNQAVQAAYLIGELSRRIGDHDTARSYFNNTIRMGQEFINEIRGDKTRTTLTRKLLEMALTQGRQNLAEAKAEEHA
jgi:tetratricopeptide (TPR) repeat protein